MKKPLLLFCLAITLLLLPSPVKGDWKGILRSEAGYHRANFSESPAQNFLRLKLEGVFKFERQNARQHWYIQARLLPEYYTSATDWRFLHSEVKGYYRRNGQVSSWEIYALGRRRFYRLGDLELTFYSVNLGSRITWRYTPKRAVLLNAGYFQRQMIETPEIAWHAGVFNVDWATSLFPNLRGQFGIYGETFSIRQQSTVGDSVAALRNSGWRLGPEIMLSYKKQFLATVQYHWLWHHSRLTGRLSSEHWVRAVFGKIIKRHWSVFLLADYYFRSFHLKANANTNVVYAPFNTQNRVHIKLERDLSASMALYLTLGYLNENLLLEQIEFSGWRSMAGLRWRW